MTIRSIVLGLVAGAIISAVCFFNDAVIGQSMLIPHQFPPVVYGSLVAAVLLVGLICHALGRKMAFTGAEWAVSAALCLASCGIPSWGLVQTVPPTAIMTHHYARFEPGWQSERVNVVELVPERMLVDVSGDDGTVLNGYLNGLGDGTKHIPISAVPWAAWAPALWFWVPFILSLTVATFGLAALVHRQWAHHEVLPYPITVFAHALLPGNGEDGESIYRNRLFWLGALGVTAVTMNNYLARWLPELLIAIDLRVNLSPFYELLPFLNGQGYQYSISFAVIGLAYFLQTRVSMSVGLMPYIYTGISLILMSYGVSLGGGDHMGGSYNTFLYAGGYTGVFLLLLHSGRHYYWNALRHGICLPSDQEADEQAVWGMRVFLAGMLVFVGLLVWIGLDWQLALLFAVITVITLVVISRAVAETGAFVFGTFFLPAALLLGFMGHVAVGPEALIIMSLAGSAVLLAPGWAPMAFVVQGLKLVDLAETSVFRTAKWSLVVPVLCIPIALGATLYWSYDQGAPRKWPMVANQYPGRDTVGISNRLDGQGTLETAKSLQGFGRFLHICPDKPRVAAFVIITALAILCGLCSRWFTWWPFHPVMFLFLGSFHGQQISVSLLLGCALKASVIRYGGAALYKRLKPLMVGLIAGSVLSALIPMVVGLLYFVITGMQPVRG